MCYYFSVHFQGQMVNYWLSREDKWAHRLLGLWWRYLIVLEFLFCFLRITSSWSSNSFVVTSVQFVCLLNTITVSVNERRLQSVLLLAAHKISESRVNMKKLMFIIRMFHGNNNLSLRIRLSQIFWSYNSRVSERLRLWIRYD